MSRARGLAIRLGAYVEQINGHDIEKNLSSISSLIPLTEIYHKGLWLLWVQPPGNSTCLDDKALDD